MSKEGLGNPLVVATAANAGINAGKDFLSKHWVKIAVFLGISITGYIVYKKLTDSNVTVNEDPEKEPSSISETNAKQIAEILYNAMYIIGTNTNDVLDALAGLNYNDFARVSKAFGKRSYIKSLGTDGNFLIGDKLGLVEWIIEELNPSELSQLDLEIFDIKKDGSNLRIGGDAYMNQTATVFEAYQEDGVWRKGEAHKTYNAGDKLGKVMHIKTDPFQESLKYAIIDKPWSFTELWVEIDKIRPNE